MHPIIADLISDGLVITDGAWGTELQARGLDLGEFPDAWNISNPSKVADVASAYIEAGSQLILTNTFSANRLRLAADGLEGNVAEINRRGVEISQTAAAGRAKVFASMGPTGKILMDDDITEQEMFRAFLEQAKAIAAAGVDGIVVESMSDLDEARLAIAAAHTTKLPVVASMVFDSGRDKDRTMMGTTPEEAAEALANAAVDAIGANCGQGIAGFVGICKRLHAASKLPIWIKANAGLPRIVDGRAVYDISPDEFASFLPELVDAGARFIGGCCGTNPDFIRAIRQQTMAHC